MVWPWTRLVHKQLRRKRDRTRIKRWHLWERKSTLKIKRWTFCTVRNTLIIKPMSKTKSNRIKMRYIVIDKAENF